MDADKIIEYVMKSPENTNPAVLKSIIETEYGKGGNIELPSITCTFDERIDANIVAAQPFAFFTIADNQILVSDFLIRHVDGEYFYVPALEQNMYGALFTVYDELHKWNVYINNTLCPYADAKHTIICVSSEYVASFNIRVKINHE